MASLFIVHVTKAVSVSVRFINNELNLRHVNVYGFDYDVSHQGNAIGLHCIAYRMHSTPLPIIPTIFQEQSMIY